MDIDKIAEKEEKVYQIKQKILVDLKNTQFTIDELIAEEILRHNATLDIYHKIKNSFAKEIPQKNEQKPRPTMKQIRDLSFEFIKNNGDSGTDDILKECEKKGYDITKQDIANALSQSEIFTFKRGKNNSKKFGKWILKISNI